MESLTETPLQKLDEPRDAIRELGHSHEYILNWLIANPHRYLRECAEELGYSQTWLSQIIHSDIFQAELKRRQNEVFLVVANDIPAKLRGLADVAIEKVSRMVEQSEDANFVMDAFDKTLHRLGYAPQKAAQAPAAPTQVNVFQVSQSDLAAARAQINGAAPKQIGATLELHSEGSADGETVTVSPTLP